MASRSDRIFLGDIKRSLRLAKRIGNLGQTLEMESVPTSFRFT
ncbi:hypothetical protein SEA_KEELAN_117 [Gordonia phage Keelan]|nr:hypothetical protein SEA_KEELAN_117 [Gordonia phage Keelan]